MAYLVIIPSPAKKQLQNIPPGQATRILNAIEGFSENLDFVRYDVRKIKGSPQRYPRYRLRCGEYRAILFIHHNKLILEVLSVVRKHGGMDY
jgi:mRNA-degrading endonuclease RelE of RelBE toxin-antitoxin system